MTSPARVLSLAVSCLVAGWLLACSDAPAPSSGEAQAADAEAAEDDASHDHAAHRNRRPLPAFEGFTLDDGRFAVSEMLGKRLLLYFFNPETKDVQSVTPAINAIAEQRSEHNFEIVGIAIGTDRATAEQYVDAQGIAFPVIDDSSARLARQFGLRSPILVVGVDAEGFVSFATGAFGGQDPSAVEGSLRQALRLPEGSESGPLHPDAPTFAADILDSNQRFDLAAHKGQPVILVFFLHTCPHCHHALGYLKEVLPTIPEAQRPKLVGVEITGRTYAVRTAMAEEGLDFFPILFDDDGSIQKAYGVFAGVPDLFFIDREGKIDARLQGWIAQTHEPLARMRTAKIAGTPVPMILNTQGYSGNDVCAVCHEVETETWKFTTHASAYDTLVKHGADTNAECIECHVVGFGEKGGFVDVIDTPALEDVGCESCHGRGGPHLSPDFVKDDDYEPVCVTCHNATHSLGFDYATFSPQVSHAANRKLLDLPAEEQARLLAARGRPGTLLPTDAAYVGSDACQSCHASEFETWASSPHGNSLAPLEARGRAGDPDCLQCHTTAFDQAGGFPKDGTAASHPDLARVGCESCHGPGGNHVAEDARKLGTIVSLGDKCDSCVILKICGSCHDDANDPGFEFEVQEKIDRQRHGTIEAGTGKPKADTASSPHHDTLDLAARARAISSGG